MSESHSSEQMLTESSSWRSIFILGGNVIATVLLTENLHSEKIQVMVSTPPTNAQEWLIAGHET